MEDIKAATAEYKTFVERAEKIRSQEILGGRAEAGVVPTPPPTETPAEYAARVVKGEVNG